MFYINWFEEKQLHMPSRDDPVLPSSPDYVELTRLHRNLFLPVDDIEFAFKNEEEFILIIVRMQRNLVSLRPDELYVLTVQLAHDLW